MMLKAFCTTRAELDLANERLAPQKNPLLEDIGTNTSVRHTISQSGKSLLVVNPLLNEKSCSTASCHAHPESQKVLGALEVKLPLEGITEEISEHQEDRGFCLLALSYLFRPSVDWQSRIL